MVANTETFMKQSAELEDLRQKDQRASAVLTAAHQERDEIKLRLAAVESTRDDLNAALNKANAELGIARDTAENLKRQLAESEQKLVVESNCSSRLTGCVGAPPTTAITHLYCSHTNMCTSHTHTHTHTLSLSLSLSLSVSLPLPLHCTHAHSHTHTHTHNNTTPQLTCTQASWGD